MPWIIQRESGLNVLLKALGVVNFNDKLTEVRANLLPSGLVWRLSEAADIDMIADLGVDRDIARRNKLLSAGRREPNGLAIFPVLPAETMPFRTVPTAAIFDPSVVLQAAEPDLAGKEALGKLTALEDSLDFDQPSKRLRDRTARTVPRRWEPCMDARAGPLAPFGGARPGSHQEARRLLRRLLGACHLRVRRGARDHTRSPGAARRLEGDPREGCAANALLALRQEGG